MKEKVIRVNAWFTAIFFAIMAIVTLLIFFTENFEIYKLVTFLLCVALSMTGWLARRFGLKNFKFYKSSRPLAVFSLVSGILFVLVAPVILVDLFGTKGSVGAIIGLVIIFFPVVISSIGILISKPKKEIDYQNKLL